MKTNLYLTLIAVFAAGFFSCTNEDLISETPPTNKTNEPVAMSFDVHTKNQTRAASTLQSKHYYDFGVWAKKTMPEGTTGEEYQTVMDNYLVGYYDIKGQKGYYGNATPTIGGTDSNDDNYADDGNYTDGVSLWFYAGLGSSEYNNGNTLTGDYFKTSNSKQTTQTLQTWDFNSTQTEFFAYAPYGDGDKYEFNATNKTIQTKDYVWAGFSNQDYVEPLMAYYKVEKTNYGKDVQLTFKRINAAVQLAFYAPIPGFDTKVTAVSFECAHLDDNGKIQISPESDKVAYGSKVKIDPTTGNIVEVESNLCHIATSETEPSGKPNTFSVPTGETVQNNYHGDAVPGESYKNLANIIGKTNDATVLSYSPNTFYAMPASVADGNNDNTADNPNSGFQVHVEFTLYSQNTDETQDLSGDVFIPATHTQWKSNYKYVYIFKLTHETPIVFDGVTISDYETGPTVITEWPVVGETSTN